MSRSRLRTPKKKGTAPEVFTLGSVVQQFGPARPSRPKWFSSFPIAAGQKSRPDDASTAPSDSRLAEDTPQASGNAAVPTENTPNGHEQAQSSGKKEEDTKKKSNTVVSRCVAFV